MPAPATLREITDKKIWDETAARADFGSFLAGSRWLDLADRLGEKTRRLGIFRGENLVALVPMVFKPARRGAFWLVSHGPVFVGGAPDFAAFGEILGDLKKIARDAGAVFVRISPPVPATRENFLGFEKLGFRPAPIHAHAEETWLLDLTPPADEIFKNFSKDHRYYARRAEKNGVEVRRETGPDAVEKLISLHEKHARGAGYGAFSPDFLRGIFAVYGDDALLFSARIGGKIEDMKLAIRDGRRAAYYVGASDFSPENRQLGASHFLMSQIIFAAKNAGATEMNFWGVAPEGVKNHPLAGVSRFKKGFGGREFDLLHAMDLRISPRYFLTRFFEKIRAWRRGYGKYPAPR